MSTYLLNKPIRPTLVTKKLVTRIESLILETASELEGEHFTATGFEIRVRDKDGLEVFRTIEDHSSELFANDIKSIEIRYTSKHGTSNLSIEVDFLSNGSSLPWSRDSSISFMYSGERAREQVIGRSDSILRAIAGHEVKHFFNVVRPSTTVILSVALLFFLLTIFRSVPATERTPETIAIYSQIFQWLAIIFILVTCYVIGMLAYSSCFFDSTLSAARLDRIKYYSRAWVIGLLGVSIIKILFTYAFPLPFLQQ